VLRKVVPSHRIANRLCRRVRSGARLQGGRTPPVQSEQPHPARAALPVRARRCRSWLNRMRIRCDSMPVAEIDRHHARTGPSWLSENPTKLESRAAMASLIGGLPSANKSVKLYCFKILCAIRVRATNTKRIALSVVSEDVDLE
jgi:hypothetical protein